MDYCSIVCFFTFTEPTKIPPLSKVTSVPAKVRMPGSIHLILHFCRGYHFMAHRNLGFKAGSAGSNSSSFNSKASSNTNNSGDREDRHVWVYLCVLFHLLCSVVVLQGGFCQAPEGVALCNSGGNFVQFSETSENPITIK